METKGPKSGGEKGLPKEKWGFFLGSLPPTVRSGGVRWSKVWRSRWCPVESVGVRWSRGSPVESGGASLVCTYRKFYFILFYLILARIVPDLFDLINVRNTHTHTTMIMVGLYTLTLKAYNFHLYAKYSHKKIKHI